MSCLVYTPMHIVNFPWMYRTVTCCPSIHLCETSRWAKIHSLQLSLPSRCIGFLDNCFPENCFRKMVFRKGVGAAGESTASYWGGGGLLYINDLTIHKSYDKTKVGKLYINPKTIHKSCGNTKVLRHDINPTTRQRFRWLLRVRSIT